VNSFRFWMVLASVVWFASGLATGLLAAGVWKDSTPETGGVEHYTARMITEFDMEPERARLFRHLMDEYQEEIEAVKKQHMAQQASAMEPELRRLGERYNELIRDRVLSQAQREEFDRLCTEIP
jgi:hypothetical protein